LIILKHPDKIGSNVVQYFNYVDHTKTSR